MINKKYLKNLRCKEINNKNDFIYDLYSERLVDSLEIINLNFKNILILGDHGTRIHNYILKRFKNSFITICDFRKTNSKYEKLNNFKEITMNIDLWDIEPNKYNLIISNFFLNCNDNISFVFGKIINSLIPNGLFLSTLPSKKNFDELKSAMIKTDIELYGGAYNRFNKTTDLVKIIEILKKNNFKIPLVNLEQIKLEYKKFDKLLYDIRSMNLSYYYQDKKNTFEKKKYFKVLEKHFKINYDKNFSLTTEFYIISGWKNHNSQQKPLKPGEAKNKLSDFLK